MSKLFQKCLDAGVKMTEQRKAILKALEDSGDHPSVEELCERAKKIDKSVSIATVYRTLGFLDEMGLVLKHDFGQTHARFEVKPEVEHEHHHLIDIETGKIMEFQNEEFEKLVAKIAASLGYEAVDHTFEIFGHKIREK